MQTQGESNATNSSYDAGSVTNEVTNTTPNTTEAHDAPIQEQPEQKQEGTYTLRSLILTILAILALAFGIRFFVAAPYLVEGASMEETFHTFDYLMVDRITYDFSKPQRGDVIVLKFPLDTSRSFIKRIIGLPGDTVIMKGESVEIKNKAHPNGFYLTEPYIAPQHQSNTNMTVTLKAGQYFVLGDNRKESADSRYWGILPADDIVGKPFVRLYPFNQIGFYPGQARYSTSDTATSTPSS